jgi:hypothetical protein
MSGLATDLKLATECAEKLDNLIDVLIHSNIDDDIGNEDYDILYMVLRKIINKIDALAKLIKEN